MPKTFHLTITQIGQNIFDEEAVSVELPGVEGAFTVLANHEAFVSPLNEGKITIVTADGERKNLTIPADGIAEVSSNQATVIL